MKCEEIEGLIVDYLDNKLDAEEVAEIEKHLETCEKCLDGMREIQEILKVMSAEEMKKPEDSLRINFYHMLHDEIKRTEKTAVQVPSSENPWYFSRFYRVAAGILLLICGTFIGMLFYSNITVTEQHKELSQMKSEVDELRKTALFTMLKDQSSSYRIQAVNYAEEIETPDVNVIDALVKTLNNDRNVNVRMAAAYALAKYTGIQSVRDSLVKSLPKQNEPILQVTLINILVTMKEKSALKPIEQIISDKTTMDEVRAVAENGARLLEI